MQYTQYISSPFIFELSMNIKLSISLLLFLGVLSGCSSDKNADDSSVQDSIDNNSQVATLSNGDPVEDVEVDYGMGHYTDENIDSAEEYYTQAEPEFEERGDIVSDDLAMDSDNISIENGEDLFEIQIYSKLNEGREYARNNIESARNFPPEYDTFISFTSDYDGQFTFNEVVVNKGQSCRMIMNLPVTMGYGQKVKGRTDCDEDQVRHLLVQTDLGNFEFGPN